MGCMEDPLEIKFLYYKNQEKMKKISIYLIMIVALVSCSKTEKHSSVSNANNLFEKIIQSKEILHLTEFSETLHLLNVKEVIVLEKWENGIKFKIISDTLVVNESEYPLNEKEFSISKQEDKYIIKGTGCSTNLAYDHSNKNLFINLNGDIVNIKDLKEEPPINISSDFTVLMIIMNEFVHENLVPNLAPKAKYQATGVGFHLNQADANYFCKLDMEAILKAHPGWYSPGVTVSCVFEGLFCICTANFYSTR